ncbi:myelin-oligodendrocyte glycoprotein-like [Labrus mixtus]|uniref:myelin-oligodendrocyte glycoprotein-like n=1 Tax=Labrus mixtus TaxID=508554 RepID=UPI0029C09046|nr:myelin-oligodendrocyte glycoprotein-like [Labrus mixtus]
MIFFGGSGLTFPLWTLTAPFSLLLWTLVEGQYRVSSSSQPITASPGDDVILRCRVKPEYNVRALTIEWSRSGTLEGEEEEYVHLYRNQKDNEDAKIRAYINRTDLLKDSLRHGNVSLKIKNVTVDDQGTYRCFIPKLSSRVWRGKEAFVTLEVLEPNVGRTTESSPDLTTPEPIDQINVQSDRHRHFLWIPAVCSIAILGGVVLTLLKVKCGEQNVKQTEKKSVDALLQRKASRELLLGRPRPFRDSTQQDHQESSV